MLRSLGLRSHDLEVFLDKLREGFARDRDEAGHQELDLLLCGPHRRRDGDVCQRRVLY